MAANHVDFSGSSSWLMLEGCVLLLIVAASSSASGSSVDCKGRRVYVLDLPRDFNEGLRSEANEFMWKNGGFGTQYKALWQLTDTVSGLERVLKLGSAELKLHLRRASQQLLSSLENWAGRLGANDNEQGGSSLPVYMTRMCNADMIAYSRMKSYDCRTQNVTEADAVFVPALLQLVIDKDRQLQGQFEEDLAAALKAHPAWQRSQGADHFMVLGSPMLDYEGTSLEASGSLQALIKFTVEKNPWTPSAFGVPYPIQLHVENFKQLQAWQDLVLHQQRPFHFSLYASPEVTSRAGRMLRRILIWQCRNSQNCLHVPLSRSGGETAHLGDSGTLVLYLLSTFCLMPRGDTCTRSGIIESMEAGCIPVVFERCALQTQWLELLPPEYGPLTVDAMSPSPLEASRGNESVAASPGAVQKPFYVHIPLARLKQPPDMEKVAPCTPGKSGLVTWPEEQVDKHDIAFNCLHELEGPIDPTLWVQEVLERIPEAQVEAMRKNAVELIPSVTFGGRFHPNGSISSPEFEDALDLMIRAVVADGPRARTQVASPFPAQTSLDQNSLAETSGTPNTGARSSAHLAQHVGDGAASTSLQRANLERAEREYQLNLKQREAQVSILPKSITAEYVREMWMVPLYPCAHEARIGRWGDGGKWVCLEHQGKSAHPVTISIGSQGQASFEEQVYERLGGFSHVLDLTLRPEAKANLDGLKFLKLYEVGVAAESDVAKIKATHPAFANCTLVNVPKLMKMIGTSWADLFKIDCEGCEVGIVAEMARQYSRSTVPFGQIEMEIHQVHDHEAAQVVALLKKLEALGYRLFHVEPNQLCPHCWEIALIHEKIV